MHANHRLMEHRTSANTEDVVLFSEQQRQALHQQQGLAVAQGRRRPLLEHLI